ncbi:MAG: hypothetical protein ACK56F_07410, partial [bacterium]
VTSGHVTFTLCCFTLCSNIGTACLSWLTGDGWVVAPILLRQKKAWTSFQNSHFSEGASDKSGIKLTAWMQSYSIDFKQNLLDITILTPLA